MKLTEKFDKEFVKYCRQKYNNINNRCNNRDSYKNKNISNRFDFDNFVRYAHENGLKNGYHCHRPSRNEDYKAGNLIFIPASEHLRISAIERRKLSHDQIAEIQSNKSGKSLRQLAKIYGVSHMTISNIQKGEGYYTSNN